MKIGKLPETVWKRSVGKQLYTGRTDVLMGAESGSDYAALAVGEGEAVVCSVAPVTCAGKNVGRLAVIASLNKVAASGAEPAGVLVSLLLPTSMNETQLRELICEMDHTCREAGVQIVGGHMEVTRAVRAPLVTVSGIGKVPKDCLKKPSSVMAGMDILVTNWIGLEGTVILAKEKEEALRTRYAQPFIERAAELERYLPVWREAKAAMMSGAAAMHNASEGGFYGALWELAQSSGVGLEIDLKKIPIRQETVEICEFFDLNPYKLISGGCMLIAAAEGNTVVRAIEKEGGRAAVIGKATKGNDRVLVRDGERRFLETVQTDEIHKIIE